MSERMYALLTTGLVTAAVVLGAAAAYFTFGSRDFGYIGLNIDVLTGSPPRLYLNSNKLEPLKKGVTILRQQVGTAKLEIQGGSLLCNIAVKKDRITSLKISERRCQCQRAESSAPEMCLS
jgi:hypothetical protein